MCRLFGFRSVISSQVHSSLLNAENALATKISDHPDGWGVAYYLQNIPHIVKSAKAALNDNIFKKVSGIVSSETVLAHIRKTTVGNNNALNTHPFQYGKWVFAHNGHIVDFDNKKEEFQKHICPKLKSYILGETDSEYIFYFILTKISKNYDLSQEQYDTSELVAVVNEAVDDICKIVGNASEDNDLGATVNYFTFILTNGKTMIGHQRGKKLHYSTFKSKCPERDTCSSFSEICEKKAESKDQVNHLILSSEPLSGENIWHELKFGETVAVNHEMIFKKK
jgi:glutamine amidotransferase